MTQPMMTFHDGHKMPQLGTGIFQIPNDDTAASLQDAFKTGYRLIDGAAAYQNEQGFGDGVRQSDLPREEIFVTSKLWNDMQGFDAARKGFDSSMDRLGLDYLDLYLIHWPVPAQDLYVETWKALIVLQSEGRIRSIGVANFHEPHLQRLIDETGVTPVLNQIELHPTLNQSEMRKVNERLGIITQSWTPLGKDDFKAPEIEAIAKRIDRTGAQVLLRWHIQHGVSTIPKSSNPDRLAENFACLDFTLTDDDMAKIDALDAGNRTGPDPETFDKH